LLAERGRPQHPSELQDWPLLPPAPCPGYSSMPMAATTPCSRRCICKLPMPDCACRRPLPGAGLSGIAQFCRCGAGRRTATKPSQGLDPAPAENLCAGAQSQLAAHQDTAAAGWAGAALCPAGGNVESPCRTEPVPVRPEYPLYSASSGFWRTAQSRRLSAKPSC
jgi:hypothetical protein